MRLTLRVFGHEVLSLSTDDEAPAAYDPARDLSGGTTGIASEVHAGRSDCFMGFTNGRDFDDDDE